MIEDIQEYISTLSLTEQSLLQDALGNIHQDTCSTQVKQLLHAVPGGVEKAWRQLHLQRHMRSFPFPLGEKSIQFVQQHHRRASGENFPQFPYLLTSVTSLLVRFISIITIQSYLTLSNGNDENINVAIVNTLRSPTDNQWWALAQDILQSKWLKSLQEDSPTKNLLLVLTKILQKDLAFSATEKQELEPTVPWQKTKKLGDLFRVILQFRNDVIHAEPMTEKRYTDVSIVLLRILQALVPITEYKLCSVVNNTIYQLAGQYPSTIENSTLELPEKELVLCTNNTKVVSLSPLLSLAQDINVINEKEDIFFINAGSLRYVNYIGFVQGEHKDAETLGSYEQFKKYLSSIPIPAGATDNPRIDFSDFVADKGKYFVGRHNVLEEIQQTIASTQGTYIILKALAGMGKSSIMAHLYAKHNEVYEANTKGSGDIWLFHFCMRTEGRDNTLMAYRSLLTQLQQALGTYSKKNKPPMDIQKLTEEFQVTLNSQSTVEKLTKRGGQKIVVVIDALDESQLQLDDGIVQSIPGHLGDHVHVVLSYRVNNKNQHLQVENAMRHIAQEKRHVLATANPLTGLDKSDVHAFLYKANNNQDVIENVQNVIWQGSSQVLQDFADPFYLRFVIDGVEKHNYSLKRAETIPTSLHDAFEQMWLNLPSTKDFLAHRLLITLGIMRDLGDDELFVELFQRQFPDLNIQTEDMLDVRRDIGKLLSYDGNRYGLFHDRFRFFLVGEQVDPVAQALSSETMTQP